MHLTFYMIPMENSDLLNLIRSLPKADLHRHLEGSIPPKVVREIAKENDASLPTYDLVELTSILSIKEPKSNLKEFVKPLELVGRCLCSREAIQKATYEAVKDAYLDNVECLELQFNPAFWSVASVGEAFDGLINGKKSAEKKFTIKVGLIVGFSPLWKKHGWFSPDEIFEAALIYRDEGIVGINMVSELKSGTSLRFAKKDVWENFLQISSKAKEEGLFVTVHAGEIGGPESARDAIENLGADRIGHGINVVKDRELMEHVIRQRIPLELCLTSNLLSGVARSLREHPFKKLYEAKALVTLNTDDPSLCQTTLTSEYVLAAETFKLDSIAIKEIIKKASHQHS